MTKTTTTKINIGIAGFGNVGKGVIDAVLQSPDMNLMGIFTRRDPAELAKHYPTLSFYDIKQAKDYTDIIDVMILCGGSATDLPVQGPELTTLFTTVDSFDTHAKIPTYFDAVDRVAKENNHLSIISVGWDPGLFSLHRVYAESILSTGKTYTFWGKGVSQGHSDAIRRIEGVQAGIQYTCPIEETVHRVRLGEQPTLASADMHERVCYVVAKEGADKQAIEEAICTMPHYFDEYHTTVHFISQEEFNAQHTGMPHGGFVIRTGETGNNSKQRMEFSLTLDSNPEFTAAVLVAYARAAYRLKQEGHVGAKTVFDIAPRYLSLLDDEQLRTHLL